MPIRPHLTGLVFDDDAVAAMGTAFDRACRSLRLTDKDDAVTKLIAEKIIEAAQVGERDPNKLYEAVREWAVQRDATDWSASVEPISRGPR